MNKHYLQSKMKSSGIAYLLWFFLGIHYIYLGKWGWQFLYWITAGGLGFWAFFDLFTIPGKVDRYNRRLSVQIEELERKGK